MIFNVGVKTPLMDHNKILRGCQMSKGVTITYTKTIFYLCLPTGGVTVNKYINTYPCLQYTVLHAAYKCAI